MNRDPFVSVVVPCLNEARTLPIVLRDIVDGLTQTVFTYEIVVADNGSTDTSRVIAKQYGARVVKVAEKGYGAALLGGFRESKGQVILYADADATYDFKEGPRLIIRLLYTRAGLVLGTRIKGTIRPGAMPLKNRYLGTPVLTWIINQLYGTKLTDCNSGFRCFHKDRLERWNLTSPGMELASEMLVKCAKTKDLIEEVSITLRRDINGRTPHLRPWRDGWRHLRLILRERFTAKLLEYAAASAFLLSILSIRFWNYFTKGYTFIVDSAQMQWVDWCIAREAFYHHSGHLWNSALFFGVNVGGREAAFHPLALPILLSLPISDHKTSYVMMTFVFLWGMGWGMYHLLRTLDIHHHYALAGSLLYMMAPKWIEDIYIGACGGPRQSLAYAVLPWVILAVSRCHYLRLGIFMAAIYLSVGASFTMMLSYLIGSYWIYSRCTLKGTVISIATFLALTAYILGPFIHTYFNAQRSLYGEGMGFLPSHYLGMIFPWINRIYSAHLYDFVYPPLPPVLYPNMCFYFGILALPLWAWSLWNIAWTKTTKFFFFYPAAVMVFWSSWAWTHLPMIPWLERLTGGQASDTYIHVTMIFCFAIIISSTLQRLADAHK